MTVRTVARACIGAVVLVAGLSACSSGPVGAVGDLFNEQPNPGPCPRAFALYDAARIVEFIGDGERAYANVGFTGEIQNVRTICRYTEDNPIEADLEIEIGFGRGPMADGRRHTYEIFIAVVREELAVIHRETFPIDVRFDRDEDRVYLRESFDRITIPRAGEEVSGANFEILVGFVVTPEQADFNQQGMRFHLDVGQQP